MNFNPHSSGRQVVPAIAAMTRRVAGTLVLVAAALAPMLALPALASAAPGTWIPGQASCILSTDRYAGDIDALVPAVRAANTTSSVDHQTVYWSVRVYEDQIPYGGGWVADSDWRPWASANAADNTYTTAFYRTDKPFAGVALGTGWDFSLFASVYDRELYNAIYYYTAPTRANPNGLWDGPYYFWSTPSSTGGNDNGRGTC